MLLRCERQDVLETLGDRCDGEAALGIISRVPRGLIAREGVVEHRPHRIDETRRVVRRNNDPAA